jgi:hypothetical protein
MQTSDAMVVDFIKTIPEDNQENGGIKNFGKFSEGSCFEVITVRPYEMFQMSSAAAHPTVGRTEFWLICLDDEIEKVKLMNTLIKLKLKKQHAAGLFTTPTGAQGQTPNTISAMLSPSTVVPNDPNASPIDGRWILLQDWTQCTLKCDGGKSYQHMMCVPPRAGGKPCEGPEVRERPCNTQPCPKLDQNVIGPNERLEKPIVKIMPISTRPQSYDKCYLKDMDALMEKNDEEIKNLEQIPRIPIRLVMNNKSITVFQDETLHSNYYTFILKDTIFARDVGDKNCFILAGKNQKVKFCSLGDPSFVEQWDYDVNLFKNQCKEKRETVELDESEEDRLKKEYENKIVFYY